MRGHLASGFRVSINYALSLSPHALQKLESEEFVTPQCGAPSFILTYPYVQPGTDCARAEGCYPAPRYYRLLNIDAILLRSTVPNGTYTTVRGILVTSSSWTCDPFYAPKVCMTGDLYVQSIGYFASSQAASATSTIMRPQGNLAANKSESTWEGARELEQ